MRKVKQNLFWAFGYNTGGIPLATGALYPLTGQMVSREPAAMEPNANRVAVQI